MSDMSNRATVDAIKAKALAYAAGYFSKERKTPVPRSRVLRESYQEGVEARVIDVASDHMVVPTTRRSNL